MFKFNIFKKLQYNLHYKNRIEKLNIFINFVKPLSNEIILDVGIASKEFHYFDNLLEKMNKLNKWNYKIIGLSIEKNIKNLSQIKDKYNILCVQYNGKDFPFKDSSIDIVYSNAVIEHVGNFERQLFFLSEMLRIAKRCVFFTTPNKYFPIELHTKIPFIHFFFLKISVIKFTIFWGKVGQLGII